MRIEEDLKLGFKDVLIRPKRSTSKAVLTYSWNVNSLSNILARPGLVCRSLLLTWTPLARLPWLKPWLHLAF